MSGIAGIVHLDRRPVDQDQLARMLANMSHRGPDGSGVWVNKHVGLGHLMFHETPESLSEQQPCANSQSGLTITADARIDNREELAGKLELNPAQAREYADSRYILLSYAKWGEDCVHELLGDFAFAIWDGRRQALFCARDCMGLKPFYYSHKQGRFIFASELRAVTSLKDVDKSINEEKIAAHMLFDSLDKESTIYTDFFRLPPAHTLRIDSKGFQKQHYWKPDVDTELKLGSNEEYAEAFRDVFSDSVQCRLRSAFPVGSMFSGGMDSSSMTGVARELLREKATDEKLRTFSATFPHLPGSNEEHFQDELIAGGDLEAFKVSMEGHSPLRLFLDAKGQLDSYPMYGWSYYIHRLLHEKMV
ncbi:MAG: asparagine synthase-related protein, partial [Candidatus Sumerlaeota bacterium]